MAPFCFYDRQRGTRGFVTAKRLRRGADKEWGGADSLEQGMNSTTPDPHYDCKPNNPVRLISTHEQIQLISCMN